MLAQKRRSVEVFSLSFMDCICCGFGAVLLLFILTTGQRTDFNERDLTELKERVARLESEIQDEREDIERLAKSIADKNLDLLSIREENDATELKVTQRQNELQILLQQLSTLKDTMARLLEEKEAIPTQETPTLPIPNVDRQQYLTGVRMEGEHVLFLVRSSGSMLDVTIDGAAARIDDPEHEKREAPKWQRVLRSLEWLIASLDPETRFQILLFNDETVPILPAHSEEWFSPADQQTMAEVVAKLHTIVPEGSANLERAFTTVRFMPRLPDSIVLLVDGLPTASDSLLAGDEVGEEQRVRFFEIAVRQLPPRIPVSTILFPFSGDPAAPAFYWELGNMTRGALVSPSKTWPDT